MPKRTGRPWQRLRARIIQRDGGICHLCGHPGADTADHIIPWSLGGTDNPANLKAAHRHCNRVRGNRTVATARTTLTRTHTTNTWDW